MNSTRFRVLALGLIFTLVTNVAVAGGGKKKNPPVSSSNSNLVSSLGQIQTDEQIISAVQNKKRVRFLEGGNLVVTALLPDDTDGLTHQLWEAQLSDGSTIKIVYNSFMGDRVPVEKGAVFAVGGEFIWTKDGGLIHWVHADPKGNRPDGYVFINNELFGLDFGNVIKGKGH